MEYRLLGRTGLKVSPLCLGTANFADPTPEEECIAIVNRAVEAGINLIDTGNSYAKGECERVVGKALSLHNNRQKMLLATKVHYPMGPGPNDSRNSRLHILKACEDSLRRLNTDYIDIYQIHRPSPELAVEETLGALTDLVRQGKIRYVGCSTHPAWQVMEALMVSEKYGYVKYILEQSPYNLLDRRIENELVPLCKAYGLGILAWAPMAMGVLLGRYSSAKDYPVDSRAALRGGIYAERVTQKGVEVGDRFVRLAKEIGISPAKLSILWVKGQDGITAPLIGPRSVQQLKELLPVLEMKLDEEVREACDELVPPGSAAANFFNSAEWMKMKII
ncbi:MAG: aldo/keto reductase [Candidatus Aminicenantes bacterium]|nr:MAG: aldo/keto reductase [Candidatus Aminicenantes bacterium]